LSRVSFLRATTSTSTGESETHNLNITARHNFISLRIFKRLGAFNSPDISEAPSVVFGRNLLRAFNPVQNVLEVFWRPSAGGIGGSRLGGGKNDFVRMGGGDEIEGGRWKGIDGLRALAFLWVLAYELNTFLSLLDSKYAASDWSSGKNEQQFPWKLATQGYLGYGLYLVISAFLFTHANILMQQADRASGDADAPFHQKLWSKYAPLFWSKVARMWPALAAGVFFIGFLWPEYINSNATLDADFLDTCEDRWWTNMFFVANFWEHDCYLDTWAVSLLFQLAFLTPIPAYLFAQGDTQRWWAFVLVYAIITVSLTARLLTIVGFKITEDPLRDGFHDQFWLKRMPWTRAGEYAMGILVAFSLHEEQEDERPRVMDIFRIVSEPYRDWMNDTRLLFTTTLQTATLATGFMFMYEGTLQEHHLNFKTDGAGKACILVLGDLIVASAFGLLLRWSLHPLHGSWLKRFLSWPLWYPLSALSYTGFLFQIAAALWSKNILEKV